VFDLKEGVDKTKAQSVLQDLLASIDENLRFALAELFADVLSGETEDEEVAEAVVDILDEAKDAAREGMSDALDAMWNFNVLPGGPIGGALEAIDDEFWNRALLQLEPVGRAVGAWLRDIATFDDVERAERAEKLTARADELEAKADDFAVEKPKRARRLRRRAERKRERADRVVSPA